MFRRTLALVLTSLALASPALADIVRYINPAPGVGVDDTVTHGGSAAAPWRTVEFANRVLRQPNTTNGHIIVYLADWEPGYDRVPCPNNIAANGKRYFFIGNPSDPARCVLPGDTLYRSYVTLRGFKIAGTLMVDSTNAFGVDANHPVPHPAFGPATDSLGKGQPYADSVVNCIMEGLTDAGSKYCVFKNLTITGVSHKFGSSSVKLAANPGDARGVTVGNKYEGLAFTGLGRGTDINHVLKYVHLDSATFDRNTFDIIVQHGGASQVAVAMFMTRYSTWKYCRWTIRKTANAEGIQWKMRNGSRGNHFSVDTIYYLGPLPGAINLVQNGGDDQDHDTDGLTGNAPAYWDSCYFFNANGNFNVGDEASDLHFTYTTLVSMTSPAFTTGEGLIGDSLEFQHCTLVSPVGGTPPLEIDGSGGAWQSDLKLILKSNILYNFVPYNQPFTGDITCTRDRRDDIYANNGVTARMDSVNKNLYYNQFYNNSSGDRVWWINSTCYAVGGSAVAGTPPLTALEAGKDRASLHANPLFVTRPDSLYNGLPAFNARIAATSPARGLGYGGTDAGAVAYNSDPTFRFVPNDPDTTAITDTLYAASYTDTFTVANDGVANLEATVTALMATAGAVVTLDTSLVLIAGGKARTYTATYYTPGFTQPAGIYVDYLVFTTNDPSRPTIYKPFVRSRNAFAIE